MSRVFVEGYGIVSPGGWGVQAFRAVWEGRVDPVVGEVSRPDGWRLKVLRVPAPAARAPWQMHPRMRRASPISQFTVGAALEAMGGVSAEGLGIVSCVMGGSVQYSRRFYGEVLVEPSTASPMLFPETVFNAPASHLAAVLGTPERNDTCVADETGFLSGLVVAADWLGRGLVRRCLVVAAEEADWTTAEAARVFSRGGVASEGAAAVLLGTGSGVAELVGVSDPEPYRAGVGRRRSAELAWSGMGMGEGTPVLGSGWKAEGARNLEVRLGAGLAAAGGWACVAAIDDMVRGGARQAGVSVAGSNLQSMAAVFGRG
jgi:hypothetical protein